MKNLYCILFLISLLSCQAQEVKQEIKKADLEGYWELEGGGEIIELNDSNIIRYFNSKAGCYPKRKEPRKNFNERTPQLVLDSDESFTHRYSKNKYVKLKGKPILCKELTKEQKMSNEYNFETLWHTFNEQYAFFSEREIDWGLLKTKYKSKFTERTKPLEFCLLLEKMISELNDRHSNIYLPVELIEEYKELHPTIEKDTTNYPELVKIKILKKYVDQEVKYNNGIVVYGKINENLAYIQLNEMDRLADYDLGNEFSWDIYWNKTAESNDEMQDNIDGVHKLMKSVIQDISGTKACIIDLRFNGGGYDDAGLAFLSHFIKNEQEVYKKKRRIGRKSTDGKTIKIKPIEPKYGKSVYILTSPYSVSAAETMILSTLDFPNFKRVGATTKGAFSDLLEKQLPNGWTYTLSNEIYESMDGKVYEAIGIPPDYAIEYTKESDSLFKAMSSELETKDRALEKIINLEQ